MSISLKGLNLSSIQLGVEQATALATALESNTTLTSLFLGPADANDAALIRASIERANFTLTKVVGVAGVDELLARNAAVMHKRREKVDHVCS
jgi:hypothetical protein